MRRRFEQSAMGAVGSLAVLLAICLIGPAEAGGFAPSDGTAHSPGAECGEPDAGCARIRGHIPAASEFSGIETIGGRPAIFGGPPGPFVAGLGVFGQAAADAVSRGFSSFRRATTRPRDSVKIL